LPAADIAAASAGSLAGCMLLAADVVTRAIPEQNVTAMLNGALGYCAHAFFQCVLMMGMMVKSI
jgi:hypothetical protein